MRDAQEQDAAEYVARNRDLYPNLAEHGHLGDDGWDTAFTEGLNCLLDGLSRLGSR
ncbi:hypothetical protein [Actinomadura sp. B10D3]|uniref:hypothetical protein n=1 Tax=Actinomadura sp. B10D3 TaxID=3153557 RepID=UPI00325C428A